MSDSQFLLDGKVEVRFDSDGGFDELVIPEGCTVHFEMMDKNQLWVGLYPLGDRDECVHMMISCRGKLSVSAYPA